MSLGGVSYTTGTPFEANIYAGLKLWLKADEGAAGGTWVDYSGNGNHAVKQGSPTLTAGSLERFTRDALQRIQRRVSQLYKHDRRSDHFLGIESH